MSFFPLNEVQCGPLKQRKYPKVVIGSINAPFGYRIDERSDCKVVPVPKSFEHYEEEKRREHEQLMKILDFEKETNRKIHKKKVWQRVQQGLTEYQDEVDERRERLRELLLREQMSLTREVVDQAQHGDDARMDEMRERSEQLKKQQEEQRLAVVAAKRMQQYLDQCPEFRKKMLKKSSIDAKMVNLAQMADNEAKKRAEKELDSLWHELMLKEVEMKKEREIEEVKNRCLIEQANVTTLAKQIAGKLALEEQRKEVAKEDGEYIEQMLKKLQEEDAKKQEEDRQKREKLKKELQDQILIAKRQLAERARQEAEIDRLRQTLAEEELAKERSKIKESSAALRKELLSYLQYLEELRKEEARRNIELDRIVEQWTRDAAAKRDLEKKKSKEARQKSLQEMIRSLDEQLKIKCHREEREMEERRLEKEALEKEIELNAKLAAHAKEEAKNKMLRYAKELEDQWTQIGEARRRERAEEIERMRLEELKQQEEYEMLTEELLNASENITPHPFKILLKQCAARYAAEKEGHCYCPPPLLEE
ncbi:cilia- and flagella-associated protein 53 [Osmia lignaria lignaria]|uniref:cilia- and flagella-associated protein 53 n=1 Tax=Osmia lignaria lignaria TaxID=1437193 RepID=UPI001478D1DB|nr:cilia- and flagella-associated protein 53-like [Osmia lignaria]